MQSLPRRLWFPNVVSLDFDAECCNIQSRLMAASEVLHFSCAELPPVICVFPFQGNEAGTSTLNLNMLYVCQYNLIPAF